MAALTKEYIDTKNNRHKVEHLIVSANDKNNKEQLLEELFRTLTRPRKHIPS